MSTESILTAGMQLTRMACTEEFVGLDSPHWAIEPYLPVTTADFMALAQVFASAFASAAQHSGPPAPAATTAATTATATVDAASKTLRGALEGALTAAFGTPRYAGDASAFRAFRDAVLDATRGAPAATVALATAGAKKNTG